MATKKKTSTVVCRLPRAGLGNQLFPLMKAALFAHLNNLPLKVTNYHQLKIGPWLRNDRTRRNYNGFFTFEKSSLEDFVERLRLRRRGKRTEEPDIKKIIPVEVCNTYFFFKMPHYTAYFKGLELHRPLVMDLLNEMIEPSIHQEINQLKPPVIGVHIRMGDFQTPVDEEELGKRGNLRTPLDYFIRTVRAVRKMKKEVLPVTVFSDGSAKELNEILKLPEVSFSTGKNDLVDLILLSKSQIMITSPGSTFSYWAGFLSDATIIKHPTYTGIKIRPESVRKSLYEGAFDEMNEQFVQAIAKVGEVNAIK